MNSSQEDNPKNAVQIASIVVVNFIYWMVMITAIGIGVIHSGQCPVQHNIPIYLIVIGASGILALTLSYIMPACGNGITGILIRSCAALLYIFHFCWFITGTHWIFSVYPPNYSPGTDRYCHKTAYQFAFIVSILQWVAIAIALIFIGCFLLLTCCIGIRTRSNMIPHRHSFYGATNNFHAPIVGDA